MKRLVLILAMGAAACGTDDTVPTAIPCTPAPGTICTIAGTGKQGFAGDGGPAVAARFYEPIDLTIGPNGHPYIVDYNNYRVREVLDDGTIQTVVGNGINGDGFPDGSSSGPALGSALNHPTEIVFGDDGKIYMAAWHNSRIKRIDLQAGTIEDLYGTAKRTYTGDGGPARDAGFDLPVSIKFDSQGRMVVSDQANQVIRRIDKDTTVSRIAGKCIIGKPNPTTGVPDFCDAPVACEHSDKLTCQDPSDVTYCNTVCSGAFSEDGKPALDTHFSQSVGQNAPPTGKIVLDKEDDIYIADTGNHRVRFIDAATGVVTTVAGTGTPGYSGDGGPAASAQLRGPVDLALTDAGELVIADTDNHCVRIVDGAGLIKTLAGKCGEKGFSGDGGDPAQALLNRPYGVAVKGQDVYIADSLNHRIRLVMR